VVTRRVGRGQDPPGSDAGLVVDRARARAAGAAESFEV